MLSKLLAVSLLVTGTYSAVPFHAAVAKRADCPNIHVFGARETSVSAGYGSSSTVVDAVKNAYSGATSEAIDYPACGGQSSCGGVSYSSSVTQGVKAVASAVNSYNSQCPDTQLVLVGYSQVGSFNCTRSIMFWTGSTDNCRSFRGARSWTPLCVVVVFLTKAIRIHLFFFRPPL